TWRRFNAVPARRMWRTGERLGIPEPRQDHANRSSGSGSAPKSRHWLAQQTRSLLPTAYYDCVMTLPEDLNALVLANPTRLYPLLFDSAAQSLLSSSGATTQVSFSRQS